MPSLRIGELVEATGGSLVRGDPLAVVSTFAIDTRELQPGGLFFALPGSRTDGHAFLEDAARRGASAAVVQLEPGPLEPLPPAIVRVASTVEALASCGTLARDKARSLRVAAVTGSAGKTMTKEFLAAGLAPGHRVHRTAGNLNNHLGVPLTLLACPEDAEVAVIEMGMSGPGEIAALTRMARPAVGVITNVGPAHLQFFDSLDDIAAAKGELFALLGDEGIAVVNLDDEQLCVQAQRHAGPQVTFGRHPAADFRLKAVEDRFLPGATLTFVHQDQERRLELRIGGGHAARDALAAMAAVAAMRGDLDAAMEAMARVEPGPGRGRIHRLAEGIVVVDDSYNSNPPALQSVLRTLAGTPAEGRKVVVMGDMLELGREEIPLHKEAGRQIGAAGVALLFTVGALAQAAGESARRAGVPEVHHCADAAGAAAELPEWLQPGDLVVVKGSRRLRLEQVVEAVVGQRGGRA